jgi:hypothetical protein
MSKYHTPHYDSYSKAVVFNMAICRTMNREENKVWDKHLKVEAETWN